MTEMESDLYEATRGLEITKHKLEDYWKAIERVRELAESFEVSEQGFDFPGEYIALKIRMALDGEK